MDLNTLLTLAGAPASVLAYAPAVMGVASIAAAVLPRPAPDSRWSRFRAFLDLLALNVGNARNAPAVDLSGKRDADGRL